MIPESARCAAIRSAILLFMNESRLTRADVIARLRQAQEEILALGVRRLALFGSVLHGTARRDSDVDFLVQFSKGCKSYDRFLALAELMEQRLGYHVDLITTEALSPFIGPSILFEATDVLFAA